jgi:hypothetical protein
LHRSATAPLEVMLRDDTIIKTWPVFRQHMWHTRSILLGAIRDPTRDIKDTFQDIIRSIPLCIESLEIHFESIKMASHTWVTPLHQGHDPNANPFPRLRRVFFYDFSFNWKCGILRDLKTLIINNNVSLAPFRAKVEDLLDAVAASPHLEHLELVLTSPKHGPVIRRAPFPPKSAIQRVPMNYLQAAVISESLGGAFLARFALPVIEDLKIKTRVKSLEAGEETVTLDALSDIFHRSEFPLDGLNISIRTPSPVQRTSSVNILAMILLPPITVACDAPMRLSDPDAPEPLTGNISFRIAYDSDLEVDPNDILNAVFKSKAPYLNTLSSSCGRVLSSTWTRIFQKTPNIQLLSLSGDFRNAPEETLLALNPYAQSVFHPSFFPTNEYEEQDLLLPKLESLMMDDVLTPEELREDYDDMRKDADWVQYDTWHKMGFFCQLVRYREMRLRYGYEVEILTGLESDTTPTETEDIEGVKRNIEEFRRLYGGWYSFVS